MNDRDTRDRLARLEQRFEILDQRIDERSKNLRDAFHDVDGRIAEINTKLNELAHLR